MRYFLFISLLFLFGCAQQVPPSGGPKDVMPPQVIEENTVPRNKTVNFISKTIVISFDEFVKLNNPGENIIISPALPEKPEYLLKGKKLYIKLKSDLKSNTTYTINFGNCITDITENNPAAGLTYVFSTGASLDSLSVRGQVTNAFTGVPEKGVWVLLHKNLSDTSFQKNFPDYLAKTDNNGFYSLQNLAGGDYKIFALKDGNSDYKYSQPSEEIAFHTIYFQNDTLIVARENEAVNLKMFNESSEKQYLKSSRFIWPGKLQMVMNKRYDPWMAYILPYDTIGRKTVSVYKNAGSDTIDVWLRRAATENGSEIKVVMPMGGDSLNRKYDTVTFRVSGVKETIPSLKLKSNASENFGLLDKLKLKYDRPAFLAKKEKMHLYKNDTVEITPETEILGYGSSLVNQWEEKTDYTLILEDSAFADVYFKQYSKADTIKFTTVKKDWYGNLITSFTLPEGKYIFQLLGAGDKVVAESKIFHHEKGEDSVTQIAVGTLSKIEYLKPGNYKARIFKDENENGQWDTGKLSEKKQPERVWNYKEPIIIRSNWDFELNWKIDY